MPNQRATGQTLIGCHLDADFVAEIDAARGVLARSQFLRDALFFYLRDVCKRDIPESWRYAPDRAGKGGRPKKVVKEPESESRHMLNESAFERLAEPPKLDGPACACDYHPTTKRKKKP